MYEWFEAIAGPNYAPALMWTLLALLGLFVILLAVRLIRRMRLGTYIEGGRNRRARLAILDATAVDDMRRLVLVRRDDVEHLLLIGGPSDVVVEQNIQRQDYSAQQAASRAQPQRSHDTPGTPAPGTGRPEPRADKVASSQTHPQVPPVTTPAPQAARNAEPQPAADNPPSGLPPAPSSQRQEPVMTPVAAASAGAVPVQTHAAAPSSAGSASSSDSVANAPASHSIDLDDALLSELESSLEPREESANEARQREDTSAEISLDEEMSRLLGDLSDDNRR